MAAKVCYRRGRISNHGIGPHKVSGSQLFSSVQFVHALTLHQRGLFLVATSQHPVQTGGRDEEW